MRSGGWRPFWTSLLASLLVLVPLVGGTVLFDNDLLHGIIVCLVVQFLLYVIQKRMTVGEYFARFFSGVKGMTTIAVVVGFGLMLSDANRTCLLYTSPSPRDCS